MAIECGSISNRFSVVKANRAIAALKHDPAESGPFAGNARFCGRGGQIVVGWRQRTGGMESVRRMSKGFLDGGTIARRAFPDAAYAALERMFR
ncbi:MAG: hypothetical protein DVS81_20405 [Candidatus Accumulibacter meliphilus]|uniref:Uncharacterized protein n=1 Tax=Candidatus Accumulibacter meliphilus TaxID=2211374 RepID=A0A369XF72_9PROT|nr:MAG: hypothetical protein DVS81_20405 [Candidatus Accumulibacter meliphilus]